MLGELKAFAGATAAAEEVYDADLFFVGHFRMLDHLVSVGFLLCTASPVPPLSCWTRSDSWASRRMWNNDGCTDSSQKVTALLMNQSLRVLPERARAA